MDQANFKNILQDYTVQLETIRQRLQTFENNNDEIFKKNGESSVDHSIFKSLCEQKRDFIPMESLISVTAGVERIGYIVDYVRVAEMKSLPDGAKSRKTMENVDYMIFYGYNTKWQEIEEPVAIKISFASWGLRCENYKIENLGILKDTDDFLSKVKKYNTLSEDKRREEKMTITVGMWEDLQKRISSYEEELDYIRNRFAFRKNYEW